MLFLGHIVLRVWHFKEHLCLFSNYRRVLVNLLHFSVGALLGDEHYPSNVNGNVLL